MAVVSLLDILNEEDALNKERERNFNRRVTMMYRYDNIKTYPSCKLKDEDLANLQEDINASKQRETEIDLEILEVRKRLRRYAARLLES